MSVRTYSVWRSKTCLNAINCWPKNTIQQFTDVFNTLSNNCYINPHLQTWTKSQPAYFIAKTQTNVRGFPQVVLFLWNNSRGGEDGPQKIEKRYDCSWWLLEVKSSAWQEGNTVSDFPGFILSGFKLHGK